MGVLALLAQASPGRWEVEEARVYDAGLIVRSCGLMKADPISVAVVSGPGPGPYQPKYPGPYTDLGSRWRNKRKQAQPIRPRKEFPGSHRTCPAMGGAEWMVAMLRRVASVQIDGGGARVVWF